MFRIWQEKRLHYHLIFVELELQEQKKNVNGELSQSMNK